MDGGRLQQVFVKMAMAIGWLQMECYQPGFGGCFTSFVMAIACLSVLVVLVSKFGVYFLWYFPVLNFLSCGGLKGDVK